MSRLLPAILVAVAMFTCFSSEAQSSYLGRTASKHVESPALIHSTTLSYALAKLTRIQKTFRELMAQVARQLDRRPSSLAVMMFLALCTAYGVVHAAGPGHGKSVLSAYFVARGGDLKGALLFGNLLAFFHVGSAALIILVLTFVFKSSNILAFNAFSGRLFSMSYLLITVVGLGLLIKTLVGHRRSDSTGSVGLERTESDSRGILGLAFASGIIPCPGAALILLFTLKLGILWVGLLGMIALAVGMGITTSAVACAALGLRGAVCNVGSNFTKIFRPAYVVVSTAGAVFITMFGLLMFIGSLSLGSA